MINKIIPTVKKYLPARFWLAGPLAMVLSIVIMASSPVWLPHNSQHLYHMVFPVLLFPLIWGVCFFYPLLENNIKRAFLVMIGALLINLLVIIFALYV